MLVVPNTLITSLLIALGTLTCIPVIAAQDDAAPAAVSPPPTFRHEYKWSFKGPLDRPENNKVPFWDVVESAMVSEREVRLVPSVNNRKGSVWNQYPVPFNEWEILVKFSIYGRSQSGADGMTIWLTEDRAETGNIFGSKDFFKGLGLMIDTYDNDGKRDNPSLYAVIGDGNTAFNHNNDGGDAVIGKCRVYARNAINPLTIRASYADKTLMVSVDETSNGKYYEPCFTVSKIEIPTGYYFGVSAATGGLADDHIVQSFQTFSRQSAAQNEQRKQDATLKLSDEEHEDLVRKFGEHVAEFNANQNAYKQEHKDDADYQEDPSEVVNGYGAKTLEAISEFQRSLNAMFQFEMKELDANIKNNHILVLRQLKTMKKQIQQINEKMELQGNLLHESVGEAKGSSGDTKSLERLISSMGIKIDAMTEKVGALEHKYDQLEKGIKFQQESGHKDIKRSLKQETQKMKAHVEEGGNSYFWAAAVVVAVQVVLLIAYIVFKKTSEREKKFI